MDNNILFLGHGYVSQYFCSKILLEGFNIAASINSSKEEKHFKSLQKIKKIDFSSINNQILDEYDNFIISIPPFYNLQTDIIIDKFYNYFLNRKKPYKLIYLCATSVYGDHGGKKVNEESPLKALSINGLARIACENKYLKLKNNQFSNIIILRLAGIYGEKRNNISSIYNKEIVQNKTSSKIISRIHVNDIAMIIKRIILSKLVKNQIFNLADDNPCPTFEVNDYICQELFKMDKLPIIDESKEINKKSSFYLDSKIVDNSKIKNDLGYKFIYPSYKDGLRQIFDELNLSHFRHC